MQTAIWRWEETANSQELKQMSLAGPHIAALSPGTGQGRVLTWHPQTVGQTMQ